jgi:hypothetical protein
MNYHWIGHCKEGTSDKIWGIICLNGNDHEAANNPWTSYKYVSFWGRRGKALQTKVYEHLSHYEANKLCDKKEDKGYKTINTMRLEEVYPEFEQDLEQTTVWAMLSV